MTTLGGQRHTPERNCILSGGHAGRDDLIRLALGPDGQVAPDVRARAPGRGAWIGVDRPTLEAAKAKGKLKGALARAFKTGDIAVPADLGARIEAALRQAVLDRLGLEAQAGEPRHRLATGSRPRRGAARSRLLLHAADASADGRRKLDQAWRVGRGHGGQRPRKAWFSRTGEPYCHWRLAAKMWYMSPSSIGPRRRV